MNSFIIVGNKTQTDEYIAQFILTHAIKPYYIEQISSTVKIEDIRNLKKKLSVKTYADESRLIVFGSEITIEAQNALLKLLEEPPASAFFVIETISKDKLLPTIVSRCQVVHLRFTQKHESDYFTSLIDSIGRRSGSASLDLGHSDIVKDSENFRNFVVSLEQYLVKGILNGESVNVRLINLLNKLQDSYSLIEHNNINKRLFLETLSF